jgi:O-acetyl-ADP-ribose deacetylase (regulator of RNase III)
VEEADWTNPSVLQMAEGRDPIQVVTLRAQQLALDALDAGWSGPPFDPFDLARLLRVPVVARQDQLDARTIKADSGPVDDRGIRIEYNPSRPEVRLRWSVAHEIAHTLFPDVADQVRHRTGSGAVPLEADDSWQLELLCNLAAGELLMPTTSFTEELPEGSLDIDLLMELRLRYGVSAEAVVRKAIEGTARPAAILLTARDRTGSSFRVDYVVSSRAWHSPLPGRGTRLPSVPPLADCTAVGFTARGTAATLDMDPSADIQAVGIPPYPGHRYPRVLVLATTGPPDSEAQPMPSLNYVTGDATQPRGKPPRLIAHVVNDSARGFGGGFARALAHRFPRLEESFRAWTLADPEHLRLGSTHMTEVEEGTWVASAVAQRGFGSSIEPRIRYHALSDCLADIQRQASKLGASVHVPRIGAGQAGGSWQVIAELLDRHLCRPGVPVTVYTLPGQFPGDAVARVRSEGSPRSR